MTEAEVTEPARPQVHQQFIGRLRRRDLALALIFAAAVAVRLWWLLDRAFAIENDGAEYARIAQNLAHGHGYVGLQPGPELLFPPVYPWLITALAPIFGTEHAGRVISLIAGSALTIPVYLIGRRLYGRVTGLVAASLVAFSPVLTGYSTAVLSESMYLTVQLSAAYLLLRAHDRCNWRLGLVSGLCWAAAILIRPEAAVIFALLTLVGVVGQLKRHKDLPRALAALGASVAACTIAVLPYSAWTSAQAHRIVFDGKATVTAFINQRIANGATYYDATVGISSDGIGTGVLLQPNDFISGHRGSAALISPNSIARSERASIQQLWRNFGHRRTLGAPLLGLLASVGLLGGPWTRRQTKNHALLLCLCVADCIAFGSVKWFEFRFLLPLVPIILLFAARGIVRCAELANVALNRRATRLPTSATTAGAACIGILALSLVPLMAEPGGAYPSLGVRGSHEATAMTVGNWLRNHGSGGQSVMSESATLAYYSAATWYPMGFTSSSANAAAYLEYVKPTYLVLADTDLAPFETTWLASGVPDAGYHRVRTFDVNQSAVVVYQRN